MATDSLRAYLDALRTLEETTQHVHRIKRVITDAADKLQEWRRVIVSGTSAGFPVELTGAPSISANDWPTAEQLAEALRAWHQASDAADHAWRQVPAADRRGLQPAT